MHFTSNIEIDKIIEKCFEKELDDKNPDLFINNYYINAKKEKYKFKKMGAIYVSVRLGVSTISSDYFPSIKNFIKSYTITMVIWIMIVKFITYIFFNCKFKNLW